MALRSVGETTIESTTGEIVDLCTRPQAVALTQCIRDAAEQVWSMLVEAHDRRAWAALGYATWSDYVRTEFDMSRSRSYQLIDQGRVVKAIEQAVSTSVDTAPIPVRVTEAEARDIKPRLKEVTKEIAKQLADDATVEPERVQEIVADVIAEHREKKAQHAEDRAAIADLNEQAKAAGMETDPRVLAEQGAFARICNEVSKQGDPAEFVARHRSWLNDRRVGLAEKAYAWLDAFLLEVKEGQ